MLLARYRVNDGIPLSISGAELKQLVAAKSVTYARSYPECTEEPTRREGATGPERPKRMRPDGAECYEHVRRHAARARGGLCFSAMRSEARSGVAEVREYIKQQKQPDGVQH